MEVNFDISTIKQALVALKKSLDLQNKYAHKVSEEDLLLALRDSTIQKFEICIDLLWKVLKKYLENVEKITLTAYSPKGVIRDAVKARIITEDDSKKFIKMIDAKNQTSHIYREEIAEEIGGEIEDFYTLMKNLIDNLQKRIN